MPSWKNYLISYSSSYKFKLMTNSKVGKLKRPVSGITVDDKMLEFFIENIMRNFDRWQEILFALGWFAFGWKKQMHSTQDSLAI